MNNIEMAQMIAYDLREMHDEVERLRVFMGRIAALHHDEGNDEIDRDVAVSEIVDEWEKTLRLQSTK